MCLPPRAPPAISLASPRASATRRPSCRRQGTASAVNPRRARGFRYPPRCRTNPEDGASVDPDEPSPPQAAREPRPPQPHAARDGAAWRALDRRVLWHPFTQQRGWSGEDFPVIASAEGCTLIDVDGRRYLDGVSSLWCAIHGHRVPAIDAAVGAQLARVAHSTLLGLGQVEPIALAEELLEVAPPGLSRVFYSDSGSTAVEVALKMAFQHWRHVEGGDTRRTRFLCLQDAYHGDTIGSVSVGGIDLFHATFRPLLFAAVQVPVPHGPSPTARAHDAARCLAVLDELLADGADTFAALVLEPGVQGAAGIRTLPEGFTAELVARARAAGVLVIADEVATGFGRSGRLFACEREVVRPDLLCLAKGLSGGYLPLAATLAAERVYAAFLGEHEELKTFFHGHTFTGNALACAAARASLALCRAPGWLERARALGDELAAGLAPLAAHPQVLEVRRYGAMFGIELVRARGALRADGGVDDVEPFPLARRTGHRVALAARARGAVVRPLGDTVVLMPPLTMDASDARRLVRIVCEAIDEAVRDDGATRPPTGHEAASRRVRAEDGA
ncbi:MAG: adenosylmethionine--8-amino-7-oxononanoate transaminase [Planctomycetes bacterium]|nr:adenosylmethionine--8-amino-7-oxononanoate transaminase [Planctomycetota bacterium]